MTTSHTRRFVAFQRRWLRAFDQLASAYGVQGDVLTAAFVRGAPADFRSAVYRALHDGDITGKQAELLFNHGGREHG